MAVIPLPKGDPRFENPLAKALRRPDKPPESFMGKLGQGFLDTRILSSPLTVRDVGQAVLPGGNVAEQAMDLVAPLGMLKGVTNKMMKNAIPFREVFQKNTTEIIRATPDVARHLAKNNPNMRGVFNAKTEEMFLGDANDVVHSQIRKAAGMGNEEGIEFMVENGNLSNVVRPVRIDNVTTGVNAPEFEPDIKRFFKDADGFAVSPVDHNGFAHVTGTQGESLSMRPSGADFPGKPSDPTRGELYFASVPEDARRKGLGMKMIKRGLRHLEENGAETVVLSPTSKEGRGLVKKLIRENLIGSKTATSATGKTEYKLVKFLPRGK